MYRIKVLNNIAATGLNQFTANQYQIDANISDPHAILVRSANMHSMEVSPSLTVVGRSGAGTNNIPVEKLTAEGIPVLNTPGANANAVKELVLAGMLLAARNICSAWDFVRHLEGDDTHLNETVEQQKKLFSGIELPGKTLAVVGLGSIGVKVANAALNLGMRVVGYDPGITVRNAWDLSANVLQAETLAECIQQADFISIHVPLNDATKNLITAEHLQLVKKNVILLNFAREGIIDKNALLDALREEKIKNYVCDFPSEKFKNMPHVICLPHLGASTAEAEENCAYMVSLQVKDYLENGHITNAVNFPNVKMTRQPNCYRLAIVNANVPNMVAQISTVLSGDQNNIVDMINKSRGELAYTLIDTNKQLHDGLLEKIRAIKGVIRAREIQ